MNTTAALDIGSTGMEDYNFNGTNVTTVLPKTDAVPHLYEIIRVNIQIYILPIITIFGIAGNGLSLAVMQRNKKPIAVYMSGLAVIDSSVLIMDFMNNWLRATVNIYLLGYSNAFCKLYRFLFHVLYTTAPWYVVALSIERFIAITFPFKATRLSTRQTAMMVVCLIPLPLIALYLVDLWSWSVDEDGNCNVLPPFAYFVWIVVPWLSSVFYSYLPLIIIISCNVMISITLYRQRAKRRQMTTDHDVIDDDNTERRVTITVMVISIFFVLLTLPLTLYFTVIFMSGLVFDMGPEHALIETFVLMLGLSNHAINFWLYVASSKLFRNDLRHMCGRNTIPKSQSSGSKESIATTGVSSSSQNAYGTDNISFMSTGDAMTTF